MTSAYRNLPAVETLIQLLQQQMNGDVLPRDLLVDAARQELDAARQAIASGAAAPPPEQLLAATAARARSAAQPSLQPLSDAALHAMREVGASYSNLEYDLGTGERGSRYTHLAGLLCRLTGAEAAL